MGKLGVGIAEMNWLRDRDKLQVLRAVRTGRYDYVTVLEEARESWCLTVAAKQVWQEVIKLRIASERGGIKSKRSQCKNRSG